MAANIPQMVANGRMMMLQQQQQQQQQQPQQQQQQQQNNKQLHQLVYSHLMQAMSMAPMNSWQSGVSISDRFSKAVNLYGARPFLAPLHSASRHANTSCQGYQHHLGVSRQRLADRCRAGYGPREEGILAISRQGW
jgi:hypothetical protein